MQSSKIWLLVRTLLTASGSRNILKYETDKKKRRRAVGSLIGEGILYIIFAVLFFFLAVGLGSFGMLGAVPAICAVIISVLELIFSILRVGDYLFSRKDYEVLMALPFSPRELVTARFLSMYIRNLPSTLVSSFALMAGYGLFAKPAFYVYIIWVILTVFLPLIPTVIAAVIGVLSAGISAGARHKTAVQSVFIFIFTILFIVIGQVGGRLFASAERAERTLTAISDIGNTVSGAYLPARWFSDAVLKTDPVSILLLIAVSFGIFELVFFLISRAYRRINSRMLSVRKEKRKWKMGQQKTRSVVRTIAFKEFRRFTGSTIYLTNTSVGCILVLILSVLVLFVDINWLFSLVTRGAPFRADIIIAGMPLILFFFVGMAPTTTVSWSLEGKNFWILQSLPVTKRQICSGKMLFNILFFTPFMIIGCICFGISLHVSPAELLLYLLLGVILCLYSTCFGMYCNLKHENMDWDKEAEVVKQGSAVAFYLFPNMFITMGAVAACLILGHVIGTVPTLLIASAVYACVAWLFYSLVKRACK